MMVSVIEAAGERIIKEIEGARKRILEGHDVDNEFNSLVAAVNGIIRDLDQEFRWILNLFW